MDAWDGTTRWLLAHAVVMYSESNKYRLLWDGVSGPYKELYGNWNDQKNKNFRTIDSENLVCPLEGEDSQYTGGWWYGKCANASVYLTGEYIHEETTTDKSIVFIN